MYDQPKIAREEKHYKFLEIAEQIVEYIRNKNIKVGEHLPSVGQLSVEFGVSRDTILRTYRYLKKNKIVKGVRGKGHYLVSNNLRLKKKVLCVFDRMSDYKKFIFNSILENLDDDVQVELSIYNYDPKAFARILKSSAEAYDYIIIIPHFRDGGKYGLNVNEETTILEACNNVPRNKLYLIDNYLPFASQDYPLVYQDFRRDFFNALSAAELKLKKYDRLVLLDPDSDHPYPQGIFEGFKDYCDMRNIPYEIVRYGQYNFENSNKDLLFILDEEVLVNIIKLLKSRKLVMGKDVGIIAYNDHPIKELLNVSTFSTDFRRMGRTISEMIAANKRAVIKNDFSFVDRGSA